MADLIEKVNEAIEKIADRLRNPDRGLGRRPLSHRESWVSSGIVRPMLSALEWDVNDIDRVRPEFPVEGGDVDFALCAPNPQIFVEVKALGKIRGGETQLINYAAGSGVSVLVLIDGRQWMFYYLHSEPDAERMPIRTGRILPCGAQQFCVLDLGQQRSRECAGNFCRFLSYAAVESGNALREAEEAALECWHEINNNVGQSWHRLLSEPDEGLRDLLVERVEKASGHTPSAEYIAEFLRRQYIPRRIRSLPPSPKNMQPNGRLFLLQNNRQQLVGFEWFAPLDPEDIPEFNIDGREYKGNSGADILSKVLVLFHKTRESSNGSGQGFMRQFAERASRGKQAASPIVSRSASDLHRATRFASRQTKRVYYPSELGDTKWWMRGGSIPRKKAIDLVRCACEIMGVEFKLFTPAEAAKDRAERLRERYR